MRDQFRYRVFAFNREISMHIRAQLKTNVAGYILNNLHESPTFFQFELVIDAL